VERAAGPVVPALLSGVDRRRNRLRLNTAIRGSYESGIGPTIPCSGYFAGEKALRRRASAARAAQLTRILQARRHDEMRNR
jgi:hypothetical protein